MNKKLDSEKLSYFKYFGLVYFLILDFNVLPNKADKKLNSLRSEKMSYFKN